METHYKKVLFLEAAIPLQNVKSFVLVPVAEKFWINRNRQIKYDWEYIIGSFADFIN